MKVLVILVVCLIAVANNVLAEMICNVCLENRVACLNKREYQRCEQDGTRGPTERCPKGSVCTDSIKICEIEADSEPKCEVDMDNLGECGYCDLRFSRTCVDRTKYADCEKQGFGTYNPSFVWTCPDSYICDTKTPAATIEEALKFNEYYPCVPNCTIDVEPSCDSQHVIETTPEPVINEQKLCAELLANGDEYAIAPVADHCDYFIYCERETKILASKYKCPFNTKYSATKSECVEHLQDDCPI